MREGKAAERYLFTFGFIAPLGLFVALLFNATAGGVLLLAGLGAGLLGLHRLGRQGPLDRV